jgi:hypothetical protein
MYGGSLTRSGPRLRWFLGLRVLGGGLGLSLGQGMSRGLRLDGAYGGCLNSSGDGRVPGRSRCCRCRVLARGLS